MMVAVVVALIGGSDGDKQRDGSMGLYLPSSGRSLESTVREVGVGDADVCLAEMAPVCFAPTFLAAGEPTSTSVFSTGVRREDSIDNASPDGGGTEGAAYPTDTEFATLICSYPWPCEEALAVVYGTPNCPNGESGGDPWAYNNGCYGLFEINCVSHHDKFEGECEVLYDPQVNVRVAYDIYVDNGGWSPWTCRP